MGTVLLEARPFRPFKSSEEYLVAMKEDLAEWFQTMYPYLNINADNFMDKLETGVTLCEHANKAKAQAIEYVRKKQAKNSMSLSVSGSLALAMSLIRIPDVKFLSTARPATFFARDNVSNFIKWCRNPLEIIECLLFESDDLIMRKNEKHVILCLLEVARRGANFGMLAPMLVQMERQIDREIAADMKKIDVNQGGQEQNGLDDDDSDMEDENPVLMYGPVPQIVTNDLKSLDEMVRDLVEKCTCPTQFPMIRVSEGKYRIGDTKVLIFVRILRNHVMVRVGGGWDTLAHYLDKHDPCRCRSQHRTTQGARLVNKPGAPDLHGSHVYYERSPVPATGAHYPHTGQTSSGPHSLGPPMNSLNRSRSRSPSHLYDSRRSVSPNLSRKSLVPPPNRSRSPTPNFTSTHQTKLSTTNRSPKFNSPNTSPVHHAKYANGTGKHIASIQIQPNLKSETSLQVSESLTDQSDTTSEMSDEGYRSLGLDKNKQRSSFYSQNSTEDAEDNEHPHDGLDDLNEIGLRKTNFSQRIYENDYSKPKALLVETKPSEPTSNNKPRISSRANSVERPTEYTNITSPKHLPKKSPSSSKINTWNGRQKGARSSLNSDTFTSPFIRQSTGRRSVSSGAQERQTVSACTSPTKNGGLKKELSEVIKCEDEALMAQRVQELMRKYGPLGSQNDLDDNTGFRRSADRMSYRSPRRDKRPENHLSRIPAPVSHKA